MDKKIKHIRNIVRRIVEESKDTNPYDLNNWTYTNPLMQYILDLSPRSLVNIRLHTELFNGEPIQQIIFGEGVPEELFMGLT